MKQSSELAHTLTHAAPRERLVQLASPSARPRLLEEPNGCDVRSESALLEAHPALHVSLTSPRLCGGANRPAGLPGGIVCGGLRGTWVPGGATVLGFCAEISSLVIRAPW